MYPCKKPVRPENENRTKTHSFSNKTNVLTKNQPTKKWGVLSDLFQTMCCRFYFGFVSAERKMLRILLTKGKTFPTFQFSCLHDRNAIDHNIGCRKRPPVCRLPKYTPRNVSVKLSILRHSPILRKKRQGLERLSFVRSVTSGVTKGEWLSTCMTVSCCRFLQLSATG